MKIEESVVTMHARHAFSRDIEVVSASSFRTMLDEAAPAAAPATATSEEGDAGERLLIMIATLLTRMLALIAESGHASLADLRDLVRPDVAPSSRNAATGDWPEVDQVNIRTVNMITLRERESTDFVANGKIHTADGRALDFTLALDMCRDYSCQVTEVRTGEVNWRDPLVINFDGKALDLAGKCFAFDLDSDGNNESMFALGSGSGYLAIDRNGDGRIADGGELFGTRSGNGFADLAQLDEDGNHWLDEADAAFDQLRIWQHGEDGQEMLATLREKDVGALYLGATDSPFTLTDSDNQPLAQVRASGVYVREDGTAGAVQQIDLLV